MSRKHFVLFLVILTFSFKSSNKVEDKINKAANEYLSTPGTAGIAIGIISNDDNYFFCYGDACKKKGIKVDTNTIFEIGSLTKIFTGLLLAQEVEKNKMNLNDNINEYLPQCSPSQKITLLNLATHSSGLPRLADNFWETVKYPDNPYVNYHKEDLYQYLSDVKLNSVPGKCYNYSNVGAGMLGYILATKNNTSYEDLVSKTICKPFNMNNTAIKLDKKQTEHLAVGYADSEAVSSWDFNDVTAGQGALRSTIADMMKFLRYNMLPEVQLRNSILMTQEVQFEDAKKKVEVGLGWHIGDIAGQKYLFHSGGTGGYRSYIGLLPDSKKGVVVLSNSTSDVDGIAFSILTGLIEKSTPAIN